MKINNIINTMLLACVALWACHTPIQICAMLVVLIYPISLFAAKKCETIKDKSNSIYFKLMIKNFVICYGILIIILWYFLYSQNPQLTDEQINNLFNYAGFIPFIYITVKNVIAYSEISKDDIISVDLYKSVRDSDNIE